MNIVLVNGQYVGFPLKNGKIHAHSYLMGTGKTVESKKVEKSSLTLVPTEQIRKYMDRHVPNPDIYDGALADCFDEIQDLWNSLNIPLTSMKRCFFTTPLVIKNAQGIPFDRVLEDDMILLEHYTEGEFGHNRQTLLVQNKVNSRNNISLSSLRSRLLDPFYAIIRIDRKEENRAFEKNSISQDKNTGEFYFHIDPYFVYCMKSEKLVSAEGKQLEEFLPVPTDVWTQAKEFLG